MNWLKEPVGKITIPSGYSETYDTLLKRLMEMNFEVTEQDKNKGEIEIRCLSSLFNMIFWGCFGDKLLFELKQIEAKKTEVNVFGIPNLFRIKVKKGEVLVDLTKLLFQLRAILPQ
jgi:hypothetical protein